MTKAEIIAELAQLSPEDLADVKGFLNRLTHQRRTTKPPPVASHPSQIRTPRLEDRAKSAELTKQVMDE